MTTRTKFVFLMHPKEFKREKAATGRLTHLCLANSEVRVGVGFEQDQAVQALLGDPCNFSVLLYPGARARSLTAAELAAGELGSRRLVIFLLDATWSAARKMLKVSPSLQSLPRLTFNARGPSRYIIKQQPQDGCLSTLEATHEVLLALQGASLDEYPLPAQLPALFERMQDFQMRCAADPARGGYRRRPYSAPAERTPPQGRSGARRSRYLGVKPSASAP